MDPEALVTFLFRAPPEVRTVELMGSWDNFNQPYRMHHDRRRGNGFWSGCFKFENIIFDGEEFQWTKPRSGGLKQGGTYWYYYRLNYDIDAYDDRQEYTTGCPLLPGQAVNVIDVPYEMVEPPTRCHSAYGVTEDIAGSLANVGEEKTLDPAQKMAALEPPPISKVHSRCLSDEALDGRLENQNGPVNVVDEVVSPVSTAHHEAPQGTRDSKLSHYLPVKDEDVQPESASPTQSAHKAAGSVFSDTFDLGASEYSENYDPRDLPSFPYPCDLGPTPLGSDEALAAAMFTSDDVIASVLHAHDSEQLDEDTCKQMRRISELSLGPKSVQNVQFYGSRPGTSLTEDPEQHRPRMYSLPNMEIRDYLDESSPVSPTSCYSHRASEDVDENPTPVSDGAGFDLISPTFTASTVDTEDHDSPFTMSSQTSYTGSEHATVNDENVPEADAGRHWSLSSSQDRAQYEAGSATTNGRSHPRLLSPTFVNYSLPNLASESNHSLAKTITMSPPQQPQAPRSRHEVYIPTPTIFSEGEGISMAEDIFSELGF
ncbi:hypothetical protein CLAFUW4_03410 [Fulvia fulva]|uniref:Uncharacterized protein n=1 Tax=Passalora fulva TaxID=5499 RepID=A0A9Q8L985_PASFU|nr:uncharacterized protein CLAFUR5_03391 [Fulvia fulva]KAK4631581.1 hypothetical protein CLAFUR4_03399 [Fulvia fulva]KAK4633602.1 hypothetical protein CLAFUR0_03404 [Fulvia fulva]UJO13144.1 hypothetical protein CLAFUR5_03391 [Fulvia fulva]WPV10568.1 hypothetical protein CLAFUW4_03410 [Fulvia fulva]WPV26541.1 hypothetical protein CLAFUW7_03402 [Fulvia fulva]